GPAVDAPPTLSTPRPPSLAAFEAHWPAIVERFQGNVFAKVLLVRLSPAQLDEGRITFAGRLDALDLHRLEETCRRPLEAMLAEELGVELRVRFTASDSAAIPDSDLGESVADYASNLFGGRGQRDTGESPGAGFEPALQSDGRNEDSRIVLILDVCGIGPLTSNSGKHEDSRPVLIESG